MSSGQSENLSSILLKQIESFSYNLAANCKMFLSFMPNINLESDIDDNAQLKEFLDTFSFKDDAYYRFIRSCGLFGAATPITNYISFRNSMPEITMELTTCPESKDRARILFTERMKDIDWKSSLNKIVIYYFVEAIITEFLIEMLKRTNQLNDEDVNLFLNSLTDLIIADKSIKNITVLNKICDQRKEAIYILSSFRPAIVWKYFLKLWSHKTSTGDELDNTHKIYLMKMFSSILIPKSITANLKDITTSLLCMYANKGNALIFRTESLKLLENIVLQTCIVSPTFAANDITNTIASTVKATVLDKCIVIPEAIQFYGSLTSFINCETKTCDEWYKSKYFPERPADEIDARTGVIGMVAKLRGVNFAPECQMLANHPYYKWTPLIGARQHFVMQITEWIRTNYEYLEKVTELSDLIEALAIVDLQLFTSDVIKRLTEFYVGFQKIQTQFAIAMRRVIMYGEDVFDEFELHEFKNRLSTVVTSGLRMLSIDISQFVHMHITNSFTSALSSAVDEKEKALKQMIATVEETSFPIFTPPNKPRIVDNIINKWESLIDPSMHGCFKSEEYAEQVVPEKHRRARNANEAAWLTLACLMEPDSEMMEFLCLVVFSTSPFSSSLTVRVIQAMIHSNMRVAELAMRHLCNIFLSRQLNFMAIIAVINALIQVLESANYEGIIFSKDIMNSISYVAIVGLCVPIPSLRSHIFEMSKIMNRSKTSHFDLQPFIEKFEDAISMLAMENAVSSVAFCSQTDIKALPVLKFTEIATSNNSKLYIFFISAIGKILANEAASFSKEFVESLVYTHKILVNLLMVAKKNGNNTEWEYDESFVHNCAAMLVAISDILAELDQNQLEFKIHRIQYICEFVINSFDLKDQKSCIPLMGIFSCVSKILMSSLIPLFCKCDPVLQRVLVFWMKGIIKDPTANVLDENGNVKMVVYTALHSSLMSIIVKELIPKKCDYRLKYDNNTVYSMEHLFLLDYGHVLRMAFDRIFEHAIKREPKKAMQTKIFAESAVDHYFNNKKWFTFLCNITSQKLAPYFPSMLGAFSSWSRISPIPFAYFDDFMTRIPSLAEDAPLMAGAVFAHHPEHLFQFYVNHSRNHYHMFSGLMCQLDGPSDIASHLDELEEQLQGCDTDASSVIAVYYQNIGSVIALCFAYLSSQIATQREEALDFLEKLVLVAMIIRKDRKSTIELLRAIRDVRVTMTTSFSVFIQKDIHHLSEVIADHFQFCSEQFIQEAFLIIKQKQNQEILPKKSRASNEARRKSVRTPAKIQFQSTDARISMFGTRQSDGIRSFSSVEKLVRLDNIEVNHPEVIMSFISRWLTPFSYDLQRIGICSLCEPQFQRFGIYNFIAELLDLCRRFGMIQPLAAILDVIIEKAAHFFMLCLFSLQAVNEENAKPALMFLIYLYNKIPSVFIEEITSYLSVRAWFFYEVQISKIDQLFDIDKFFGHENMNDDESEHFDLDYDQILSFTLKLLRKCYKENNDGIQKIKPYLIAFCIIHSHQFTEEVEKVMSLFLPLKNMKGVADSSTINDGSEKWSPAVINPLIKECKPEYFLEWGLCCGDLEAASTALSLFSQLDHTLTKEHIPLVLRTIQIVATILNELTDPKRAHQFSQTKWVLRVVYDSKRPDYSPVVYYLGKCLDILKKFIDTEGNEYTLDIFWTAVAFMRCHSIEYEPLFSRALAMVSQFIKDDTYLAQLNGRESQIHGGVLSLIFGCQVTSRDSLTEIFNLIFRLITNRMFTLLSPVISAPYVALYLIMPFMWGQLNDQAVCKGIAKYYAQLTNSTSIQTDVFKAISGVSRNSDLLIKFTSSFFKYLTIEMLHNILMFYTQIAKDGTQSQREAVFVICSEIMKQKQDVQIPELAKIAYYAVADQASQNSDAVLAFLRDLVKNSSEVQKPAQPSHMKQYTPFPAMQVFAIKDINSWAPPSEQVDVFDDPTTYPPMYTSNITYFGAQILANERQAIDKVRAMPFTDWYEKLFQAQLQTASDLNDFAITSLSIDAATFITDVIAIIAGDDAKKRGEYEINNNKLNETGAGFATVKPSMFFPRYSEIVSLGSEIINAANLDVPFSMP